jgi:transcriptional regulator with XRE-family HTH domain
MLLAMDDHRIGRMLRVLRHRRGWRQVDLAGRAGVSQSAVSDMERGRIDRYTVRTIRQTLRALDASVALDPLWGGRGDLDRLLDADHAMLTGYWTDQHRRAGWETWNEASYSVYGERGRIDMMAFHAPTRILEVAECKTGIWDVQDTLGKLDEKVRLAPRIAAERGWMATAVVGALVVLDGTTVRRRVEQHATLFAPFSVRGRAASAWVRRPRPLLPGTGLLAFVSPRTNHGRPGRAGQRRVQRSPGVASVPSAHPPAQTTAPLVGGGFDPSRPRPSRRPLVSGKYGSAAAAEDHSARRPTADALASLGVCWRSPPECAMTRSLASTANANR